MYVCVHECVREYVLVCERKRERESLKLTEGRKKGGENEFEVSC